MDSYNVFYAVLLITGGLLGDMYGRRRVFMSGVALFVSASIVCAAAPTVEVLIVGRALTGVAAALLVPSSLSILSVAWPDPAARSRALGIWAACNGLSIAIGPTLGGFLLGAFGWRSIFLVVVPIGLVVLPLAAIVLTELSDPKNRRFDLGGQILGAIALGALAIATIEVHRNAEVALAGASVFLVALILFLRRQARLGAEGLVPPDILASLEFRGAAAAASAMTFGMYGLYFVLLLTWQSLDHFGPVASGMALIPMALAFVIVASFSGFLSGRLGKRLMLSGGIATIAVGTAIVAALATVSMPATQIGLVLAGVGMGMVMGPMAAVVVEAVPAARVGTASALLNVARIVGATLGVAAMGTLYVFGGSGESGLQLALGAAVALQLGCAAIAWACLADTGAAKPRRPK